ncbi:Signal-induced proliferation-associated 1-like protein 3 [Bagarius yarrelli]|uniref:Signal-induced proliferation-associated 1-like protein 3 n=1 Tax=Bagarius yarrelli TaxID=175774 RepID=A0A556VCE6_BAGYA|nr:Signal-induced proliferation-associated 1-like protein 3 [Bagarius yarrelli]
MVIAPRSAEKSYAQQNLLDGEFYKSLPRAHFLRPGCFHAAAERGDFSPDKPDLCFKAEWLQDRGSWDSKSSASESYSWSPHPLAQPGFYSPKIPRSRHCEPTTEYHAHTLPLPHTKLAVFKQSSHCRPQGIKTSVVERPPLMRAAISPTLPNLTPINPIQQQTYDHHFQHGKDQAIQAQCFSSLRQCTLNSTSTKICEMQKHLWNHVDQAQSTKKQNVFSVKKWTQNPHVSKNSLTHPQSPPSPDHLNLQRDSKLSGYCKLSVYNGTCYSSHTPRDDSDSASSSQSHGRGTQNNSKQKNKQESDEAENYLSGNRNHRQVDPKSKNVFGQPCVTATLRSGCTPRPVRKTTSVVEDLKKLILMDEVTGSPTLSSCTTECPQGSSSPKFCRPVLTRNPVSSPNHHFLQSDPPETQVTAMFQSEGGLSDTLVWDDPFKQNPQNLTSTSCKLDWDSLVNAAEAYETQEMADLLAGESSDMQSGTSPESHSQHLHHALSNASDDNVFLDFPDQLSHLEAMLMRLSTDLLKEKKDKVALLAEVLKLRMSNQHLKEESLSAHTQLHKICQMFGINPKSME